MWEQDLPPVQAQPSCTLDPLDNEVRKETAFALASKVLHTNYGVLEPDRFNHFSLLNQHCLPGLPASLQVCICRTTPCGKVILQCILRRVLFIVVVVGGVFLSTEQKYKRGNNSN